MLRVLRRYQPRYHQTDPAHAARSPGPGARRRLSLYLVPIDPGPNRANPIESHNRFARNNNYDWIPRGSGGRTPLSLSPPFPPLCPPINRILASRIPRPGHLCVVVRLSLASKLAIALERSDREIGLEKVFGSRIRRKQRGAVLGQRGNENFRVLGEPRCGSRVSKRES